MRKGVLLKSSTTTTEADVLNGGTQESDVTFSGMSPGVYEELLLVYHSFQVRPLSQWRIARAKTNKFHLQQKDKCKLHDMMLRLQW